MKGNAFFRLIRVFLKLDFPTTQTTQAERDAIVKYLTDASTAIEIGVYEAVNTILIAKNIQKKGIIYGIDPFFKGRLGICYYKYIAILGIMRNKIGNKITLIEKLSLDAVNDVPKKVDFIFIDGLHSYEGLKCD